jgi:hypothetical protein
MATPRACQWAAALNTEPKLPESRGTRPRPPSKSTFGHQHRRRPVSQNACRLRRHTVPPTTGSRALWGRAFWRDQPCPSHGNRRSVASGASSRVVVSGASARRTRSVGIGQHHPGHVTLSDVCGGPARAGGRPPRHGRHRPAGRYRGAGGPSRTSLSPGGPDVMNGPTPTAPRMATSPPSS